MARDDLIEEILALEWDMFQNVRARYPVGCQQNPSAFRLHRGTQFSIWSDDALNSYRDDLLQAQAIGENLMTLKYARMENLIPPLNDNPVIERIVDLEVAAQREVAERYPYLTRRGRPLEEDSDSETSFKTYLRGELETYSNRTLAILLRDLRLARDKGEDRKSVV